MINKQETQKNCIILNQGTQTSLSAISLKIRSNTKRFTRNGSMSKSKSKDKEFPKQFQDVYIKNVFQLANKRNHGVNNNYIEQQKQDLKIKKRDPTPVRARKNNKRNAQALSVHGIDNQLNVLKLERQCEDQQKQLVKNNVLIIGMQNKISKLEEQITVRDNQITYLTHKLQQFEDKQRKQYPNQRKNNLTRLRKQIAQTKNAQIISTSEAMLQQIKYLQIESYALKDNLPQSEVQLNQCQQSQKLINIERQSQLHCLITQLKKQIKFKNNYIHKIETQINILKLKESCQKQNQQQTRNEELTFIKFRLQNLLKKYQQSRRQLAAYKRKQERINYLFVDNRSEVEDINFQLSP